MYSSNKIHISFETRTNIKLSLAQCVKKINFI